MEYRKDIEHLIKQKMEHLQLPYKPTHWELLLKRLRQEQGFELKEDELTDKCTAALSSLNDNHSETSIQQNWKLLEEQLYEEGLLQPKVELEVLLRNRLRHREEPYNPLHWEKLAQRIDREFSIFYRLLRNKIVEFVAMLLLIISILQYIPFLPINNNHWLTFHPPTKIPAKIPVETKEAPPTFNSSSQQQKGNNTSLQTNKKILQSTPLAALTKINNKKQLHHQAYQQQEIKDQITSTPSNLDKDDKDGKRFGPNTNTPFYHFKALPNIFRKKNNKISTSDKKRKLSTKILNPFAGRGRIGIWAAYDYNNIYSAKDPILKTPAYAVSSSGISSGIYLGMGKRHWEFTLGAAYSSLSYESLTPRLQYGTFDLIIQEELQGMQFDLLQMPIHFSLYLQPHHPQWDFYASVGISGTFVLVANYDHYYEYYASEKPDPEELLAVLAQSKFKQKTFSEGILEGGGLKNNSFLFGEVGLGIEKHLNTRWQVFLEPTYRIHLSNRHLGPNEDFLRNFSLRMGLKARVW